MNESLKRIKTFYRIKRKYIIKETFLTHTMMMSLSELLIPDNAEICIKQQCNLKPDQ